MKIISALSKLIVVFHKHINTKCKCESLLQQPYLIRSFIYHNYFCTFLWYSVICFSSVLRRRTSVLTLLNQSVFFPSLPAAFCPLRNKEPPVKKKINNMQWLVIKRACGRRVAVNTERRQKKISSLCCWSGGYAADNRQHASKLKKMLQLVQVRTPLLLAKTYQHWT